VQCRRQLFERGGSKEYYRAARLGGGRIANCFPLPKSKNVLKEFWRCAVAFVSLWRVAFELRVVVQAKFTGSVSKAFIAAKRTNAKFLIACGMQLITLLVMLSRAMSNT
jgi:hypothetical protein